MMPSYNVGGPMTSSTNQSGMNSTTHPNAHLIFAESSATSQSHFVNTATIPLIKNGEPQGAESMKGAYTNTQMLDRLFNQNVQSQPQQTGKTKRSGAKGSSAIAVGKTSGQI